MSDNLVAVLQRTPLASSGDRMEQHAALVLRAYCFAADDEGHAPPHLYPPAIRDGLKLSSARFAEVMDWLRTEGWLVATFDRVNVEKLYLAAGDPPPTAEALLDLEPTLAEAVGLLNETQRLQLAALIAART